MQADTSLCLLTGIVSVKAAVTGGIRHIEKIYVDEEKKKKRDRKILAFLSFLSANNVEAVLTDRDEIERVASAYSTHPGASHGGVIALCGRRAFDTTDTLLADENARYFVFLDGMEDPFNLGYAIRSFYAMGASGILLPDRDLHAYSDVIARASAGASECCRIAKITEDEETLMETLRRHDLSLVCSALSPRSISFYDFSPSSPFLLVIGGEKRGISPVLMNAADTVVHIPYARDVRYSLPAAGVCAMFASRLYPFAVGEV